MMDNNEVAIVNSVDSLQQSLEKMPTQMMTFSRGLRRLYAESAVSGAQNMESFRKVRDAVRDDATVYVREVLPVARKVVNNIISYFENYLALNYEEWEECVEEIVDDLASFEKSCEILIQMHETLMTSLKKREDEANIAVVAMEQLTEQHQEKVDKLEKQAADKLGNAKVVKVMETVAVAATLTSCAGVVLAPVTMGTSLLVSEVVAGAVTVAAAKVQKELEVGAKSSLAQAVSEKENALVAANAAELTRGELIPVLKEFMEGLSVCQRFFAKAHAQLELMHEDAKKAVNKQKMNEKLNRHYKMMRRKAEQINTNCNNFIGSLGEVGVQLIGRVSRYWTELQMDSLDR
jgi:hypothetical protein